MYTSSFWTLTKTLINDYDRQYDENTDYDRQYNVVAFMRQILAYEV